MIKLIKLVSGEMLVGGVEYSEDGVLIYNPMELCKQDVAMSEKDQNSDVTETMLSLSVWLPGLESQQLTKTFIMHKHVITECELDDDFISHYIKTVEYITKPDEAAAE